MKLPKDTRKELREAATKQQLELTLEERQAILRGDYTAIKRPERPEVVAGQTLVLRWSRGGKQFIERMAGDREKAALAGAALTIDIPRKPTVWVEFRDPEPHDDEWRLGFIAHDEREPTRMLAGPPSPPGEPGLKTRWRPPSKVPKRTAKRSWTTESERGYGGGKAAVDDVSGVDDEVLSDFARRVAAENALRQSIKRDMSHKIREERRLIDKFRPGSNSAGANAVKRRIQRAERRAESSSEADV